MGVDKIVAAADAIIGIGSKIAKDENIQEFVCGNYADGSKRNVMDAVRNEHLSPEQKKKADDYARRRKAEADKKKKKKNKKKKKTNIKFKL